MARPASSTQTVEEAGRKRSSRRRSLERGRKKVSDVSLEGIAGWKAVQARGAYWEELGEVAGNLVT